MTTTEKYSYKNSTRIYALVC